MLKKHLPCVKSCIRNWGKETKIGYLKIPNPVRVPATYTSYCDLRACDVCQLFCALESHVFGG